MKYVINKINIAYMNKIYYYYYFNYMEIIIINANQAEILMWRVSITHKHIK